MQETADLENTVQTSVRRFEESPFIDERMNSSQVIRGVYAGRYLSIYNGEDVAKKYWTLRRKAVIFDLPEKPLEIEAGILGNLTFMDMTMTPFEVGFKLFIDMGKDDFVRRDALIGKDQRSLLLGLTCQTETPTAGEHYLRWQ